MDDGHCFLDYETICLAAKEIFAELKELKPEIEAGFESVLAKIKEKSFYIGIAKEYVQSNEDSPKCG